ncbi:MFS transporter, partial [Corynebacterium propinquum]
HMLYAFFSLCALILVWRIRPKAVTNLHQVDDAPLHHVAMPDSMSSSPLVAALDPRVDEAVVQEQMQTTVAEPGADANPQAPTEGDALDTPPEHPDPDNHPHDLSKARP